MKHTVLAAGVGFTEGPLWTRDGRLLVVAMSRGLVVEVDLGGGVVGAVETGGGPNGLAEGPDDAVWVAQNAVPTNLCFAGPDLDRLVVTPAKGGRVVLLDGYVTPAPGLVMPGLGSAA